MILPYCFHPNLVLRSPKKKLQLSIDADDFIESFFNDKEFLEAIFLASPTLYKTLIKYSLGLIVSRKEVKKLKISLAKYYLRMVSRCTPFGLFSGCSVVDWHTDVNAILIDTKMQDRHTRFDMHYLCALAHHLASLPYIKNKLLYYPNTALYTMGEKIRYVEFEYKNGSRKHILSSIVTSDYILSLIKSALEGITIDEMVQGLISDEIVEIEAKEFIDEVINAQILVNELNPAVTGEEFLRQIITTLNKINKENDESINEIIIILKRIESQMLHIDSKSINEIGAYKEIIKEISHFKIPFEENKLFQTDLNLCMATGKINIKYQEEILEALTITNRLNKQLESPNLLLFAKRFYERYEDNEMPLLEVLDNESGIGYLSNGSGNIMPLINDMAIGNLAAVNELSWSERDRFLLGQLLTAINLNSYSIELDSKDLSDFKNDWNLLPPSISVMFRLLDDSKIFIESAGSSSAINLLGRFAHSNDCIHQIIKEVVQQEVLLNPSVIFAEIVHLPDSRIGNILLHPDFREYEIPFLSRSSVTTQNQIALQDLLISVKDNVIQLRSKKLNKIIVPRLSTAHNYSYGALPIYQFLADMQLQGKQTGIYFNWGSLENQYRFLPRVTHKNIIINPAQWNFIKQDIENLFGKTGEILMTGIARFKEQWKLPNLLVLADGDNELLINLEDKLMVEVWLDAIKSRSNFIIKEFLGGGENAPVRDMDNNIHTNQFIAILIRNIPAYNADILSLNDSKAPVQKSFFIGSEWLYYKIYCGYKTADDVLQCSIYPLVQKLLKKNIIDSFFFIRYSDPNPHIRLRFHLTDVNKIGYLLKLVQEYLLPFLQQQLIWNIQNDVYKRELDRYGYQTIENAEQLFYHDSVSILKFLNLTEGDVREELRWQWAIRSIDEWLTAFNYTIEQKIILLEQLRKTFHLEFKVDKSLKEQLSKKFRNFKFAIEKMMNYNLGETDAIFPLIKILKEKSIAIQPIVFYLKDIELKNNLMPSLNKLMPSYIHMLVNRIVISSPREHELVLYDILYNYYRSAIAREEKNKIKIAERTTIKFSTANETIIF